MQDLLYMDKLVNRRDRDEGFRALGTTITFKGKEDLELAERVSRGWRAFGALADILRASDSPIRLRVRLLDRNVQKVLLWGCPSWNPTVRQQSVLQTVQRRMIKRMLRLREGPEELIPEFNMRQSSRISEVIRRCSGPW